MRTSYLASFLLIGLEICSGENASVKLQAGRSLTYAVQGGRTIFFLRSAGPRAVRVAVPRDKAVSKESSPDSVKVVAEVSKSVLILVDSYPSIPGQLSFCQAGEESFLRVLVLSGRNPRETYHTKLESCRNNLALASPGLNWSAEKGTITITWISDLGSAGKSKTLALKVDPDGKTTPTTPAL